MKVLVIGGGGREHAIAWRLSKDNNGKNEIFCAPGNAGTASFATNVPIGAEDVHDLVAWAQLARPDLVVVGPEAPLCLGIADELRSIGLEVFGPGKEGAQIEGSKAFAKEVMAAANVPTAHAETFTDPDEAIRALDRFGLPVVIKADGLAAGKGVLICQTRDEAVAGIKDILTDRRFGEAGASLLVETFLEGEEASILAIVDGEKFAVLPAAQDHKRIFDHDEGPNTGGMGAYSPAPVVTDEISKIAVEKVFKPVVAELAKRGIDYRGVLYAGLMIGPAGVNVLEFNCRFGDPETEVILPRISGNFTELLLSCAKDELDPASLVLRDEPCATVVMASEGYPGSYPKGREITGLADAESESSTTVFHAGTAMKDGKIVTSGGRVLTVTATGKTLREAVDKAYAGVRKIHFDGAQYRTDIAHRAFDR